MKDFLAGDLHDATDWLTFTGNAAAARPALPKLIGLRLKRT
jgi:hypothetical protein